MSEPTISPETCTRCVTVADGTRYGCELHRPPPVIEVNDAYVSAWVSLHGERAAWSVIGADANRGR
jgi:hypothetical protein